MRLLISASNFGLSGVVTAIHNLVTYLVSTSKYEIIVFGDSSRCYFREFEKIGIPYVLFEGTNLLKSIKLYKLICDWKPNIFMPGFCTYEYIYMHRIPDCVRIIQTIQSDDRYWYQRFNHVNAFVDAFVFVSKFLKKQLESKCECVSTYIPNFVHLDNSFTRKERRDDKFHILYTGRLVQGQKRVFDIPEILKGIDGVRLHLAGTGEQESALIFRLEANGIDFSHYGFLDSSKLNELYRSCDIFLLTSAYEGLSLSLLEAMSFGCVPLATRTRSGTTEVVEKSNGYLVDIGDIVSFKKTIFQLMASDEPLTKRRKACIERISTEYSADIQGPRYEDLFDQIQTQAPRHPIEFLLSRPLPGTSLFSD